MSIDLTLIAGHHCYWLATFRRGHHQLIDQRSKTSANIIIILINAIYKKFYKYWLSCLARISAYSKTPSQNLWEFDQASCLRINS